MQLQNHGIVKIASVVLLSFIVMMALYNAPQIRSIVGPGVLAMGSVAVSFWLFRQYWMLDTQNKYFWLLLSLGMMLFSLTNIYYFIEKFILPVDQFTSATNWLWVLSYLIFFIALIYKMLILTNYRASQQLIFNIIILITFVTSLSLHYILMPMLNLSRRSAGGASVELVYPILDLIIVVVAVVLMNLTWQTVQVKWYIVLGFLTLILTDSLYFYLSVIEGIEIGSYLHSLWLLGVLLIGHAGTFAKNHDDIKLSRYGHQFSLRQEVFSYVVGILLVLFVINSYGWELNSLSLGLSFIMIMMMIRNVYLIRRNMHLVKQYQYLAYHDVLTGLYNRSKFNDDLSLYVTKATAHDESLALIMMDLDDFKSVNDGYGHHVGDELLKQVANRLKNSLSEEAFLYRLGGDEFVTLIPRATQVDADWIADRVEEQFQHSFNILGATLRMKPSIGMSFYPNDGHDGDVLLQRADAAMYQMKYDDKKHVGMVAKQT
ncbi:diguanylate cyclase (GGDEF)-like protein [Alkalibacillus flavidus]|uniref:Diguanylate cyclase (GGDEF)-like protein n=2 Tax=Alkalibacillus flavidus TaxID=546021 RepID=A0ABV2KUB4_9BACI